MTPPRVRAAAAVLALVMSACLFLPFLLSQGPDFQNLDEVSLGLSARHFFGTDHLGRDLLARTLAGGRVSLLIGFLATLISVLIGSSYGALAALLGARRGETMMRIVDVLYALPFVLIVIIFRTYRGQSLVNLFFALGLVSWLGTSRLVYGLVRVLRESDFVAASRLAGNSTGRIVLRHILPNVSGPLIAQATLMVPGVMMEEAFLSFIGLGVQAPHASWGSLIQEGAQGMEVFPWMLAFPAGALVATLFATNLLGDALQKRMDPRLGNRADGAKP